GGYVRAAPSVPPGHSYFPHCTRQERAIISIRGPRAMTYALKHNTQKTVGKGAHWPLGATLTPEGVNFAVYSQHASDVFLLLFDRPDADPTDIIQLVNRDRFIFHGFVNGVRAGQLYGYKVRGEYRPEWGLRFNDAKLLMDPYAKAVTGKFRNVDNLLLAYDA